MKIILFISVLVLCGCSTVSPSTKIFEVARGSDKYGNPKAVSLKVFDSQADFHGDTVIQTKFLTVQARDGINHSSAVREHWTGATSFGRAVIQPAILAPVMGGVLGGIPGVVK